MLINIIQLGSGFITVTTQMPHNLYNQPTYVCMNTVSRKLLAHLSTLEDAPVTLRVLLFVGTSSGN